MSLTTGGYYCGFLCVVASCERVAPETTGTGGDRRPDRRHRWKNLEFLILGTFLGFRLEAGSHTRARPSPAETKNIYKTRSTETVVKHQLAWLYF